MANYIKFKRVELMQSCITMAMEENWTLEEWEDIEKVEREIEKLRREIEGRSEEDNMLEGKITWDHCLLLQPGKRLETYLLCEGGFQE